MRRFLILTTALLAGGLLTACGDDDDDITGPESVAGTYILQTINGGALPVTVQGDEFSAGSIQLNSAGTYTTSFTIDFGPGPSTVTATGTFTVDGSTVTFVDEGDADDGLTGDDSFTGTVSGDTLTIVDEGFTGFTFVFRK